MTKTDRRFRHNSMNVRFFSTVHTVHYVCFYYVTVSSCLCYILSSHNIHIHLGKYPPSFIFMQLAVCLQEGSLCDDSGCSSTLDHIALLDGEMFSCNRKTDSFGWVGEPRPPITRAAVPPRTAVTVWWIIFPGKRYTYLQEYGHTKRNIHIHSALNGK